MKAIVGLATRFITKSNAKEILCPLIKTHSPFVSQALIFAPSLSVATKPQIALLKIPLNFIQIYCVHSKYAHLYIGC